MSRNKSQGRINKGVMQGSQRDLFGNNVHILNTKEVYRMVKCGKCERTVKSSQAKTHLSYGKTLTICKDCLELDTKERKLGKIVNANVRHITSVMTGTDVATVKIPSTATIS